MLLDLYLPPARFAARHQHAQFLDQAIAELEAVPAIAGATPVNVLPSWTADGIPRALRLKGRAARRQGQIRRSISSRSTRITSKRFRFRFCAAARSLRRIARTLEVAIVSEDVAVQLWPQQDPIGKRLKMGNFRLAKCMADRRGVVAQTRYRTLTTPRPTLYLPATQLQMTATNLVLRTTASLELVTSIAADRMRSINTDVRVMRVVPFTELLERPLARPRFNAFLLALLALRRCCSRR